MRTTRPLEVRRAERERRRQGIGTSQRWFWAVLGAAGWWGPYASKERAMVTLARVRRVVASLGQARHGELVVGQVARGPDGWLFKYGAGWTYHHDKARARIMALMKVRRNPGTRRRLRRFTPLPPPRRIDRPRHFAWRKNPDAEVMKKALTGYHARGQKVFLGDADWMGAKVIRQITGGPGALFEVKLDEPVDQENYEASLNLPPGRAKAVFEQAAREKRLDRQGRISSLTTPWGFLTLDVLGSARGTLVEFQTLDPHNVSSMRDLPGRIVGMEKGVGRGGESVIYLELFEPLALWQLPTQHALEHAKPGFYSKTAYFLHGNFRQDLLQVSPLTVATLGEMKKVPGSEQRMSNGMWALETPLPVEKLKAMLRPYLGDRVETNEGEWSMVVYFILPVWYGGEKQKGFFRPMREDLAKGLELEVYEGAEWLEGLS